MMFGQNGMMEGFGWSGGGGMFFGPLLMIGFWVLILYFIVLVIRWVFGGAGGAGSNERTALDILAERYARGEIDKREYEDRKRTLSGEI